MQMYLRIIFTMCVGVGVCMCLSITRKQESTYRSVCLTKYKLKPVTTIQNIHSLGTTSY